MHPLLVHAQQRNAVLVRLELVQLPLPPSILLVAQPPRLLGPHALQSELYDGAEEQKHVLAQEDGDGQRPPDVLAIDAIQIAQCVVPEQVDNGGGRDAAQPVEKGKRMDPWADAIGPLGNGTLVFDADLEEVGPQLEPVVQEEPDGHERPNRREKSQVAELDHHLRDILLHIVRLERRLVAHGRQEDQVLRVILGIVS